MNRNLFVKEMHRNVNSLVIWLIVIVVLISVTMSMYGTFIENQSQVMGMMSIVPKGALQFKGISNFNDMLSVLGFYAVNNVIYMMLLGSIFSIVLSSTIILKEEYNKTAEYLLTRPVTRKEVFLSKYAVLILNIFLLNLGASFAGLICLELAKKGPFNLNAFLILSFYTFLLNMLFGAVGLFLSTLVKRPRPITTLSIGLVLVFYFIFTLSKITESASLIGYLSPFKFVDTNALSSTYHLNSGNLLYFVSITTVLTFISYKIYTRKDIYL